LMMSKSSYHTKNMQNTIRCTKEANTAQGPRRDVKGDLVWAMGIEGSTIGGVRGPVAPLLLCDGRWRSSFAPEACA